MASIMPWVLLILAGLPEIVWRRSSGRRRWSSRTVSAAHFPCWSWWRQWRARSAAGAGVAVPAVRDRLYDMDRNRGGRRLRRRSGPRREAFKPQRVVAAGLIVASMV